MADDIRLVIAVDDKGLLKAITNTESLESKVKKLSSAYSRGAATYGRYDRALAQLAKSSGRTLKELRDYGTALRANEKATKKAAADAKALAVEKKKEADLARKLAAEKKKEAQELVRTEAAYKKLRASMDPTFAAQQRLTAQTEILDSALERGIITKGQYNLELQKINANAALATSGVDKFGNAVVRSKNKMSYGSMVAQQFGYQIGDFFVQVQSGQNVMVAFAQQGTQLAGLLPGIAGAVVGIGLAASTMIAGFIRARSGADDFDQALKRARDTAAGIVTEIDLLNSGLESATEKAFDDNIQRLRLAVEEARNAINPRLSEDSDFRRAKEEDLLAAESRLNSAEQELEAYRENLRITQEIADNEEKRIEIATRNASIAQQIRNLLREQRGAVEEVNSSLLDRLQLQEVELRYGKDSAQYRDTVNAMERDALALKLRMLGVEESIVQRQLNLLSKVQENTEELRVQNEVASKLAEYFDISAESAAIIARTDMASGIGAAADAAMVLAKNLGISLASARNIMRLGANTGGDTVIFDPKHPRYDPEAAALAATAQTMAGITHGGIEDSAFYNPPDAEENGGGSSQIDQAQKALDKLREQYEIKKALINATETEATLINALGVDYESVYGAETIANLSAMIEQVNALTEASERQKAIADTIESSMTNAFMSMVDGTKSAVDAFKDMARTIIAELYKVLVVQRLVGSFDAKTGTGSGIVGFLSSAITGGLHANGNAFSGGNVIPFANGGVVGSPTMFPMAGGRTGLMGEAGPEAIMPLKRGADGKLGVSVEGGSGSVVVNNNINVTGGSDPAAIRMEVAKLMPQITNATKSAVIDARRRGGQMKAAFG